MTRTSLAFLANCHLRTVIYVPTVLVPKQHRLHVACLTVMLGFLILSGAAVYLACRKETEEAVGQLLAPALSMLRFLESCMSGNGTKEEQLCRAAKSGNAQLVTVRILISCAVSACECTRVLFYAIVVTPLLGAPAQTTTLAALSLSKMRWYCDAMRWPMPASESSLCNRLGMPCRACCARIPHRVWSGAILAMA